MSDSMQRPEFRRRRKTVFHTSEEDLFNARLTPRTPQTESPAYRLAFADNQKERFRLSRIASSFATKSILR